jgi:hypothetical protein
VETHGVQSDSQDVFRVLLVGGFSGDLNVEQQLRSFFHSNRDFFDERFPAFLPARERHYAAAAGAAIMAATSAWKCPCELGLVFYYVAYPDSVQTKQVTLFHQGQELTETAQAQYAPELISNAQEQTITIFASMPNKEPQFFPVTVNAPASFTHVRYGLALERDMLVLSFQSEKGEVYNMELPTLAKILREVCNA